MLSIEKLIKIFFFPIIHQFQMFVDIPKSFYFLCTSYSITSEGPSIIIICLNIIFWFIHVLRSHGFKNQGSFFLILHQYFGLKRSFFSNLFLWPIFEFTLYILWKILLNHFFTNYLSLLHYSDLNIKCRNSKIVKIRVFRLGFLYRFFPISLQCSSLKIKTYFELSFQTTEVLSIFFFFSP